MIPSNMLPPGTRYCVAGGWAACPALAKDKDVWVWGVATPNLAVRRAELLLHIAQQGLPHIIESNTSEVYPGIEDRVQTLKVAVVFPQDTQPIHLMVTDVWGPPHVLEAFDVSTHAIAIDDIGIVHKHKGWTPVTVPPVRLRDINGKTDERMARIAARFGHKPFDTNRDPGDETSLGDTDIPF